MNDFPIIFKYKTHPWFLIIGVLNGILFTLAWFNKARNFPSIVLYGIGSIACAGTLYLLWMTYVSIMIMGRRTITITQNNLICRLGMMKTREIHIPLESIEAMSIFEVGSEHVLEIIAEHEVVRFHTSFLPVTTMDEMVTIIQDINNNNVAEHR